MATAAFLAAPGAEACSRVLYVGADSLRVVGRSLDWRTPIPTNLYVYPAGIAKVGHSLPGAVSWTSKYGAVYAVSYDAGVTEGMNECGLVVNGLFCVGSVYGNASTKGRPPMSLAMFPAWILDNCQTTPQAVEMIARHDFDLVGSDFDGGTVTALHWGITDRQGRSAMIEFVDGNINIYEGQDLTMLTNDPGFPQMNAINDYWVKKGGEHTLPGTVSSPDRFVRGYFFTGHVDHNIADGPMGVSITRSILVNLSVPYTYTVTAEKNVSSTQWRSFANLRDLRYYYDVVTNTGLFYIPLSECNLRPGAPILKLDVARDTQDFAGNARKLLKKSPGFTPQY